MKISDSGAIIRARDDQIKGLEEENAKWQQRVKQLVSKYHQIDPEELKSAKDRVEQAEIEINSKQSMIEHLRKELEERKTIDVILTNKEAEIELLKEKVLRHYNLLSFFFFHSFSHTHPFFMHSSYDL